MTDIPVLFLTPRAPPEEKKDHTTDFPRGRDEYIVKPFNFAELKYGLVRCINRTSNANAQKMEVLRFLSDSFMFGL
jgi:DNA-binding response OmpR family regulator